MSCMLLKLTTKDMRVLTDIFCEATESDVEGAVEFMIDKFSAGNSNFSAEDIIAVDYDFFEEPEDDYDPFNY